jgi:hypothetical protein
MFVHTHFTFQPSTLTLAKLISESTDSIYMLHSINNVRGVLCKYYSFETISLNDLELDTKDAYEISYQELSIIAHMVRQKYLSMCLLLTCKLSFCLIVAKRRIVEVNMTHFSYSSYKIFILEVSEWKIKNKITI